MAQGKLIKPVLFSKHWALERLALEQRGLIDPILNADTRVFVDPLLLRDSKNQIVSRDGYALLRTNFKNIVELLIASQRQGDPAWRAALRLLNLDERRENCLGYGGSSVSGSSRSTALRTQILQTAKEIVEIGVKNPEIMSLMGFLEEDVGPDTVSDMTTNAIFPALAKLTGEVCESLRIPLTPFVVNGAEFHLPLNPSSSKPSGVVLVPRDIVRDLPLATDLSDVARVASENALFRQRVSALIMNWAKATVGERKQALRAATLQSAAVLQDVLNRLVDSNRAYSETDDPDGIYALRTALTEVAQNHPLSLQLKSKTQPELMRMVHSIIGKFKFLVENGGLVDLLWSGNKPRKEKASQLVFYGIAYSYCVANNIDIAPETNMGGGPVDFKFSSGGTGRCVVELKLSTGKIVHGYQKQIEVYREANDKCAGIFLIIDVGKMGKKLRTVKAWQKVQIDKGNDPADIIVVDATRKPSASVR